MLGFSRVTWTSACQRQEKSLIFFVCVHILLPLLSCLCLNPWVFLIFAIPKFYSSQLGGEQVKGWGLMISVSVTNAVSLIMQENEKTRLPVWSVRSLEKWDQLRVPENMNKVVFGLYIQKREIKGSFFSVCV